MASQEQYLFHEDVLRQEQEIMDDFGRRSDPSQMFFYFKNAYVPLA